jgi:hypothetical protein
MWGEIKERVVIFNLQKQPNWEERECVFVCKSHSFGGGGDTTQHKLLSFKQRCESYIFLPLHTLH